MRIMNHALLTVALFGAVVFFKPSIVLTTNADVWTDIDITSIPCLFTRNEQASASEASSLTALILNAGAPQGLILIAVII